jgi:putative DNA primase/helicase
MHGLVRPATVVTATKEYFDDQDTFTQWLNDCCEQGEGFRDTSKSLFGSWCQYAEDGAGSAKNFGTRLIERGFQRYHERSGRGFHGLRVPRGLDPSPQGDPPK